MACELMACCRFFDDKIKLFPKTSEYIKQKRCFGDYTACNRYKIYKEFGRDSVPTGLDPDDTEEVNKIIQCLRKKQRANTLSELHESI